MDSDNSGVWIGLALVGVIVIVGVIYFFTGGEEQRTTQRNQQPRETETQPDQTTDRKETQAKTKESVFELPEAVQTYNNLADKKFVLPEGKAKFDHQYTRDRLEALGDAFVALSERMNGESNRARQIQRNLQDYGAAIQRDWTERHSDDVRKAFLEAYDAFDYLKQLSRQTQLDLTDLRRRAEAIDPDTLYLQQKERAERFFETAAETFRNIERNM